MGKELIEEFHLGSFKFLHHTFLGPFPDSNEVKKMVYELGEYFEVEKVILMNKEQFNSCFLKSFNRQELFDQLEQIGDHLEVDADSSNNSLWNKIFN